MPVRVPIGLSTTASFDVWNRGTAAARLGEFTTAALGLASPFSLSGGDCATGAVIAPGERCSFDISIAPTSIGTSNDTIDLAYSDSTQQSHVSYAISAAGSAPIADQSLGTDWTTPADAPLEVTVRVSNDSGYAVTLGDTSSAGLGLAAPFARTGGTCETGQVLPPQTGGACTIVVGFSTAEAGTFTKDFLLSYSWTASGGGTARAYYSVGITSGQSLVFESPAPYLGPAGVGSAATETFLVRNLGDKPIVLGVIGAAPLGLAAPFSLVGGTCQSGQQLVADQTCTLLVQFSPTASGTFSDAIELGYVSAGSRLAARLPIAASAAPADGPNCFTTGCAPGQVCWQPIGEPANAGRCVDVPPPPPACMAPCLWDAMKNCLPVMASCHYSAQTGTARRCDPLTGWAIDYQDGAGPLSNRQWSLNGKICFSQVVSYVGTTPVTAYSDGSSPIAVGAGDPYGASGAINCGPYTNLEQVPTAERDDPFIERGSFECTDWKNTYLHFTECRSETAGTCP